MSDNYIYAVARIRSLEMSLFNQSVIEQLAATKSYSEALQFLTEKGWGSQDTDLSDGDAILNAETEKTWKVIGEMVGDMSVFDVITLPDLFHNLKAAIKSVVAGEPPADIFYDNAAISGQDMIDIIKEKNFKALPDYMQDCAEEAYECLVHTGDGQMCDVIIDRATLNAIKEKGRKSGDELFEQYAEATVAVADIKIAVRSVKTAKSMEFMKRAMASCETLNIDRLAKAALSGMEDVMKYLSETIYASGVDSLAEGSSAFERWCDNQIIETIRPQKYNSFTIGALAAYILARQYEIKTVRIILTGKQNGLPDSFIRERIRETYV